MAVYFGRMRGTGSRTRTRQPISVLVLRFAAAAIGIFLIAIPSLYPDIPLSTRLFLAGSFGVSAALLYGAPILTLPNLATSSSANWSLPPSV